MNFSQHLQESCCRVDMEDGATTKHSGSFSSQRHRAVGSWTDTPLVHEQASLKLGLRVNAVHEDKWQQWWCSGRCCGFWACMQPFCVHVVLMSAWVVLCLGVLLQSKTQQDWLIGNSKLPVWMFFCPQPCDRLVTWTNDYRKWMDVFFNSKPF